MDNNELRKHICCFTGHRPSKLTFSENYIKACLEKAIDKAIEDGFVTFITGMAMGIDKFFIYDIIKSPHTIN